MLMGRRTTWVVSEWQLPVQGVSVVVSGHRSAESLELPPMSRNQEDLHRRLRCKRTTYTAATRCSCL